MKVVTGTQMNEIDRLAQEAGVATAELMENAGRAVFEGARELLEAPEGRLVVVVCGKGNNGGDGLVAARYLYNWGAEVKALLVAQPEELQGATRDNFAAAQQAGVELIVGAGSPQVREAAKGAELIIDALLGTGVRGELRGAVAEIIQAMNEAGRPVLAVDIPSGVNADTGEVAGVAVRADRTVTMALPKWGIVNFPGAEYVGKLTIADIGMPQAAIDAVQPVAEALDDPAVAALLPRRPQDSNKGMYGKLLVIAGSVGFTGAATLASLAALRMGAGLVFLAVPESLNDVMEIKATEVITHPMPQTPGRSLARAALEPLLEFAEKCDFAIIGPGLSLAEETKQLVRELVARLKLPMVLDADALTALAEDLSVLTGSHAPLVLTPHPGEMARLVKLSIKEVQQNRAALTKKLASDINGVVVLKGAATLIADPAGRLRVNRTGNPGMASGGTGDVLTGMIGGLLGQGLSPFDAAGVAVYLHGVAGDLAARQKGELGLIASDLLEQVPAATLLVQRGGRS